ncbi:MAG: YqaJ viral recombinase family protein [Loktanella sp.]|nr:YqaJ viral recombinase family protein [Loktanella sp.]
MSIPDQIEAVEWGDKERWLTVRRRDVTASQIGALFGVHEYCTPLDLYHQKRGSLRHEPRRGETGAMRRGRMFERVAVDMLREDHPDWTLTHNAETFRYFRDPGYRIGGTPDVIVEASPRGRGNVQIKTVGSVTFRKKWINAEGEYDPPLWILLQAELERYLIGAEWAAVAPLVVDEYFEAQMPLIDVPEAPGLIDAMKERSLQFWRDLEIGVEPPADYARDAGLIERLHAHADPDHEIDLTQDDRVATLIAERREAQASRTDAGKRIDQIDAEIKHIMGDASVAHVGGGSRLKWRNERRTGRWIAPSNGRVLRVPTTTEK